MKNITSKPVYTLIVEHKHAPSTKWFGNNLARLSAGLHGLLRNHRDSLKGTIVENKTGRVVRKREPRG